MNTYNKKNKNNNKEKISRGEGVGGKEILIYVK